MTSRAEAREAIYQHFETLWGNRTSFALDNEKFDPPNAPWVRFSVRTLDRFQETLGQSGQRKFATRALATIQYFEPPGRGMAQQDGHLDFAERIIDSRRIGGTTVRFFSATSREIGIVEDGRWWRADVTADLEYYHIR